MRPFFICLGLVLASIITTSYFTSCSHYTGAKIEVESYNPDSMICDLSGIAIRYRYVLEKALEDPENCSYDWIIDVMECFSLEDYFVQTPIDGYLFTKMPEVQDQSLAKYVKAYNAFVTSHNIYSQIEIFNRAIASNDSADYDELIESIAGMKTDTLFETETQWALRKAQQDICAYFDTMKTGNDSVVFPESWQASIDILSKQLDSIEDIADSITLDNCAMRYADWREMLKTEKWQKIGNEENDSLKIELFIDAIQNAQSFEEQCKLALCGATCLDDFLVLPMMKELLSCGLYSDYLLVLWDGWRCRTQVQYFGRSRDSVIADPFFNLYRKTAFEATLEYLDRNPGDVNALLNLYYLGGMSNIIRNGSYYFGNDASLTDFRIFFPEQ